MRRQQGGDNSKTSPFENLPWRHLLAVAAIVVLVRFVSPASYGDVSDAELRWCFCPIGDPTPPDVGMMAERVRTPLDAFIFKRLQEAGLRPSAETDKRTWLRRIYFDVIGLPPDRSELQAFLQDKSSDAYERVVDRLLDSHHFGERWGRHWLDLVRYAESRGHEHDHDAPNAWRYRDYIVRAFNDDVPYDRLVIEHIAGDLLAAPRIDPETGANLSILGTGFWFLGEEVHSPVDIRREESDRFDNMIDVMSKTFLGLTVACARCHDHKFDPISTEDYYALYGYLQSSHYSQTRFESLEKNRTVAAKIGQLRQRAAGPLLQATADVCAPTVASLDRYIRAARALVAIRHPSSKEEMVERKTNEWPHAFGEQIESSAERDHLDRVVLMAWVAHFLSESVDRDDPFCDLAANQVSGRQFNFAPHVESADVVRSSADWQIIADYANISADSFLSNGVAFGVAPAACGQVRLSDDPQRPLVGLVDADAAWRDAIWGKLRAATGTATDTGRTGTLNRPGGTLRTPTFETTSGRVFLLVRGRVATYAAVDSHRLIHGPLHGSLIVEHRESADWRWIEHDLKTYRGHRTHLEIVPADDQCAAVAMVVQGARAPALPQNWSDETFSVDVSIERIHGEFHGALAAMQTTFDEPRSKADLARHVAAANWMLDHPELFGMSRPTAQAHLARVSRPSIDAFRQLIGQIQAVSATAICMTDGTGEDEYVFIRGNPAIRGATVPRRFLLALGGGRKATTDFGSGRMQLAEALIDPANPLTARVMVNRIWQHYFGRGIVATPDDFGHMGKEPSHPDLLDWLALDLMRHEWSLKQMHRQILLSSAYRLSSDLSDREAEERDPQNLLIHRMNLKRLEGEIIRDQILALSGRLDRRLFGPSIPIYLTPFLEGRGRPKQSGPIDGHGRRSIYLAVRRNFPDPFFQAFDFPNPHTTVGRRNVSNVPAQALALMNNPLVVSQARQWAERLIGSTSGRSAEERIVRLYEEAFARQPRGEELTEGEAFLARYRNATGHSIDDAEVWANYCHALLNLKELIFVR